MTKLVQINSNGALAFYNPDKNIIYYDKALNKYPKLKAFIIEHEISHSRDYPNVIKLLKREIADYYLGRKLFWKELQQIKQETQKIFIINSIPLGYKIAEPFLILYSILLNFYFENKNNPKGE